MKTQTLDAPTLTRSPGWRPIDEEAKRGQLVSLLEEWGPIDERGNPLWQYVSVGKWDSKYQGCGGFVSQYAESGELPEVEFISNQERVTGWAPIPQIPEKGEIK